MANFSTRPNLDNRDFTQTTGSTLNLYGTTSFDGALFAKGVKVDMSTGSSLIGYVLTHTVDGIKLQAPSTGFTESSGGGGVGDITGATNIGGGVGVFAQKNNKDFEFKTFIPLSATSISTVGDNIYIGVNIDETRTQSRNSVPSSNLLNSQLVIINTGSTLNRSYQLPVNTISGITGTFVLDLSQGEYFRIEITGNTTLDYTNAIVGKTYTIELVKQTTNKTFALAAGKYSLSFGEVLDTTNPTTNGSSPAYSEDIITLFCKASGRLIPVVTPDVKDN